MASAAGAAAAAGAAGHAHSSSLTHAHTHDCVRAVAHYINKILKPKDASKQISGMKCMLLDRETKTIVSMVYSMHEILSKDVYLVETLDSKHESMTHIKAICLVRPTAENVRALMEHLEHPRFLEYHIFFTSFVPQDYLRKLAEADRTAVCKGVYEYYADYYAVNPDFFTLNVSGSLTLSRPRSAYTSHEDAALKRVQQGLLALLLSFKVKPYVRYQESSEVATALARDIAGTIGGERELFTFSRQAQSGVPLLLILDRREDPITPLLMPWTYQAMVHELLPKGIKNNTVDLSHASVSEDMKEVVFAASQDSFLREHMYDNYGDLGNAVAQMFEEYQRARGMHERISSIEDMQRFVEKYPELKSKGLVVSKHVAIMSEMKQVIEKRGLMDLSEIEQNISCGDAANDHFRAVTEILGRPGVDAFDALRLVMLYCIRYEKTKPEKVAELRRWASTTLDLGDNLSLIDALLAYGGANVRRGDLFGTGGSIFSRTARTFAASVRDVENVFTQHNPYLMTLVDQLARSRLRKEGPGGFPYVGPEPPAAKFSTVIVFVVGGVTFEEAAKVADWNAGRTPSSSAGGPSSPTGAPPFRVVLGGTTVHNSKSFLAELKRIADGGGIESSGASAAGIGLK